VEVPVRNRFYIAAAAAASILMMSLPALAQNQQQPATQFGDNGQTLNGGRLDRRGKNRPPAGPTPRMPDGHVNLNVEPGKTGLWEGNAGSTLARNLRNAIDNPFMNLPSNLSVADVPFQPWARELYAFRQGTSTKDDPHVRCKPSGGPRMYHTPYGMEFIEMPELQRIYVLGVGGPHTWRLIYMDGREHPKDLEPTFQGHSVGHWEGDTLVVDTVGFNERFWITREGLPHTEKLHLIERFTRTDSDTMKYEATVDDPGAYTAPWTGGWYIRWQPNEEMYEYMCQDNNRDVKHMYGGER
jgi:hypothetical protein